MIDLLLSGLIAGLCIVGVCMATHKGMILHRLDVLLDRKLPTWLYKPLLGCPYCMASVWGSLIYLLLNYDGLCLLCGVIHIPLTAGIVYFILKEKD